MAKGEVYRRIKVDFELEVTLTNNNRTGIVTKSNFDGFPVGYKSNSWMMFSNPYVWELVTNTNPDKKQVLIELLSGKYARPTVELSEVYWYHRGYGKFMVTTPLDNSIDPKECDMNSIRFDISSNWQIFDTYGEAAYG